MVTSGRTSSSTVIPEQTYYQYDSKGKRLRKVTENQAALNSTPTLKNSRTYIEGYEFYKDYGSNEITHSLSLIDGGQRFVMVEDSNTYGYLVRYQHPNHQSSSSLETDATGNVISYEEYHPFGTTSFQATNASITASYKRYRYTGMERDEETGLSYHNARYYISWLGRWLSPDPIGIGDGVNVYGYCGGNPVGNTDTEGTQTTPLDEQVKNIKDEYDKMKSESVSAEDRNAATTKFTQLMDALIEDVNKITDKEVQLSFSGDLFFEFLKTKGLAEDSEKKDYNDGCVGISTTITNAWQGRLITLAKYETFDKANEYGDVFWTYAIQLSDTQLLKSNPEVKKAYEDRKNFIATLDPKIIEKAVLKANAKSTTFTLDEANYLDYKAFIAGYENNNVDFVKKADGTIDLFSWDAQAAFVYGRMSVFNYGLYYKPNVIFSADQNATPEEPMNAYISNRKYFEKQITETSPNLKLLGCTVQNPCYGYPMFNRQVFGRIPKNFKR